MCGYRRSIASAFTVGGTTKQHLTARLMQQSGRKCQQFSHVAAVTIADQLSSLHVTGTCIGAFRRQYGR